MPNWNEDQYTAKAQGLASAHVHQKAGLSDLVEKTAREHGMNQDEIRTLARMTNVAVFQEMFRSKKASEDRMVEFETVDPEQVISRITKVAKSGDHGDCGCGCGGAGSCDVKVASAFELPDLRKAPLEAEKVAGELEEREAPKPLQIMRLRKLASVLEADAISANYRWDLAVNGLARSLKKAAGYGPDFNEFEKDAYATAGMDALPELTAIRQELRMPAPTPNGEKVASLQDRHLVTDGPLINKFRDARAARETYVKLSSSLAEVNKRLRTLGA